MRRLRFVDVVTYAASGLILLVVVGMAAFLTGCGPTPTSAGLELVGPNPEPAPEGYYPAGIEPELEEYVFSFELEMSMRGLDVGAGRPSVVVWRSLEDVADDTTIGLCYWPDQYVFIHPRMRGNPDMERAVVYHELAHCVYGMAHDEEEGRLLSPRLASAAIQKWDDAVWMSELDRLALAVVSEWPSQYIGGAE